MDPEYRSILFKSVYSLYPYSPSCCSPRVVAERTPGELGVHPVQAACPEEVACHEGAACPEGVACPEGA